MRLLIIIPTEMKKAGNSFFSILDPEGGGKTYPGPKVGDDQNTPTHYISSYVPTGKERWKAVRAGGGKRNRELFDQLENQFSINNGEKCYIFELVDKPEGGKQFKSVHEALRSVNLERIVQKLEL